MRVFDRMFLLRVALAVPVAGLVGAAVSTFTTQTTIASARPNCVANDWTPRGFCSRNRAYCAAHCADPYKHPLPLTNLYSTRDFSRAAAAANKR